MRRSNLDSRTVGFRTSVLLLTAALAAAGCRPDGPTSPLPQDPLPQDPSLTVTVQPGTADLPVEGRLQLEAIVRDEDGAEISVERLEWSSSDGDVAGVNDQGEVTGRALGSATITASANGASGTAEIEVKGFLLGPDGGEAASADGGARVEVPSGALSGSVTVTLEPAGDGSLPGGQPVHVPVPGSAYSLDAGPQPFAKPVKLTLRYAASALPSDVPESTLRLRKAENGQWTEVQGSQLDTSSDEVRAEVSASGLYAAVGLRDAPPDVSITAPANGSRFFWGEQVTFTGQAEDILDGQLGGGSLVWTSSRDGQLGTGPSISRSNLTIGDHTIRLTATNSRGQSASDEIAVTIENNPPQVSITQPADGSTHVLRGGQRVSFEGRADDPEDGRLRGNALVWTSDRDGVLGTGESTSARLSGGEHTITLMAEDSHGSRAEDEITITVVIIPF